MMDRIRCATSKGRVDSFSLSLGVRYELDLFEKVHQPLVCSALFKFPMRRCRHSVNIHRCIRCVLAENTTGKRHVVSS